MQEIVKEFFKLNRNKNIGKSKSTKGIRNLGGSKYVNENNGEGIDCYLFGKIVYISHLFLMTTTSDLAIFRWRSWV